MIRVAVMGYGTIGSGVVEVLDINKNSIAKRAGEEIGVKYHPCIYRKNSG